MIKSYFLYSEYDKDLNPFLTHPHKDVPKALLSTLSETTSCSQVWRRKEAVARIAGKKLIFPVRLMTV